MIICRLLWSLMQLVCLRLRHHLCIVNGNISFLSQVFLALVEIVLERILIISLRFKVVWSLLVFRLHVEVRVVKDVNSIVFISWLDLPILLDQDQALSAVTDLWIFLFNPCGFSIVLLIACDNFLSPSDYLWSGRKQQVTNRTFLAWALLLLHWCKPSSI